MAAYTVVLVETEDMAMNEIEFYVKSTIDGSAQPSLFFSAEGNGRPLLVGLHTWSFDRHNHQMLLPLAERLGFNQRADSAAVAELLNLG